ncbi:MAG: response regulator transcription factor [Bacteroidales bacterium]
MKYMKVLVCEDDEMIMKMVEYKMSREGYEVILARNGKEAAEKIKTQDFDLIITDLLMPYMTGLELVNILREKLGKKTPVIVLSKIGLEETVLKAFNMGADDYMVKPFSPSELSVRASRLLHKNK